MLMKKYPISHLQQRSKLLRESTLEYLEIQPPAEAMLPWTDFDNEVSSCSWRGNQAVSPPSTFLNEFLSEKLAFDGF